MLPNGVQASISVPITQRKVILSPSLLKFKRGKKKQPRFNNSSAASLAATTAIDNDSAVYIEDNG